MSAAITPSTTAQTALPQETKQQKAERKRRIQPIPGYADYTEAQHVALSEMKTKLTSIYEKHGFTGFISRPLELWDNLRKDGTDQQVFRVCRDDGSSTDLALPFDRTVSLALYVAKYANNIAFPFKRHDISISHRGEHPQPGRFRGFFQADVDIVSDRLSTADDVECVVTLMDGLNKLGIKNTIMYLNEINLPKAMVKSIGVEESDIGSVLRCIDKLDKKTQDEVVADIMEVVPNLDKEKLVALVKRFDYRGSIEDFELDPSWGEEAEKAMNDLKLVFKLLPKYGIDKDSFAFSPGMVRGLAYYTGLVFETFIKDNVKLGSIASGGRYVDLVGNFNPSLKHIGGVGGAIGLTRLFDILTREKLIEPTKCSVAPVTIACRSENELPAAIELATALRKQGMNADLFTDYRAKKFFSYADKKKIPYAVLISDKGYGIKEMLGDHGTNKQHDFESLEDAVNYLMQK